jgi:hypothetical protein
MPIRRRPAPPPARQYTNDHVLDLAAVAATALSRIPAGACRMGRNPEKDLRATLITVRDQANRLLDLLDRTD